MAEWRFVVIRRSGSVGQRRMTCRRIKNAVEARGVASQLPLVKYELGRGGEYYLGLAVNVPDADDGLIPEVAKQVLESASVPDGQAIWPVDAAGLDKLLGGSLDCDSFTIPITYEPIEQPSTLIDWSQVIQQMDSEPNDQPSAHIDISDSRFDHLLWWCSAVGSGDAARLTEARHCLEIDEASNATWPVLRRLVLLGHMEYEASLGLRWAVTEPTLVERAGTPGENFLAGQRSPECLAALAKAVPLDRVPQSGAPLRISVHVDSGGEPLSLFGRPIRSVGCAAENLAEALPSIGPWAEMLPVWDERDFGRYEVERYCADHDSFLPPGPFSGPSEGFHRFRLDAGDYSLTTLAYYNADTGRWRCGDFYGLRFLARARASRCEAHWHAPSQELLVPSRDRWPMPYERALVLASGLLPRRLQASSGEYLFAYSDLTEQLAQRLCTLLGIEWKVTNE